MDKILLGKHIQHLLNELRKDTGKLEKDLKSRTDDINFYSQYTEAKLIKMNEDEFYTYISRLWAMIIWGNKKYRIDEIIGQNGFSNLKKNLAELIWGKAPSEIRWDRFRSQIYGMGPAIMSEILCKTKPDEYMLWNRRAYVALNYLGVEKLPRYDYQFTGKVYKNLCNIVKEIAHEMKQAGFFDTSLLSVDYFFWDELQIEENLSKIHSKKKAEDVTEEKTEIMKNEFMHNDIRDKLRDIGEWLGLDATIEQKVAEGSKVDTIWESKIGNMGRVIYVFEVQTKGSIDSLIINLLKSLNNPAVQGVVAVSDKDQLEIIKKNAQGVKDLRDKLKYWDYEEVLKIHDSLEFINTSINNLGLVPQGF